MTKLYIENKTKHKFKYKNIFNKILKHIKKLEKLDKKAEVNLIICTNETIKDISIQYRNIDSATDVLSFPSDWKKLSEIVGYYMLGDIYISYEKILEQAKKYCHSDKREWCYIFTHAVFHLLNYDHKTKKEENVMNSKVDYIIKKIKVGRDV